MALAELRNTQVRAWEEHATQPKHPKKTTYGWAHDGGIYCICYGTRTPGKRCTWRQEAPLFTPAADVETE